MSRLFTWARILTITRRDAMVYRYTMHDRDLIVGGNLYKSLVGVTPTNIERDTTLQANNMALELLINDAEIAELELRSGRFAGARFLLQEVDYTDPDAAPPRTLLLGFLGQTQISGKQARCDVMELEHELSTTIGRTIQLRCDADLGDARCKFALTPVAVTVTTGGSALTFTDSGLVSTDEHFSGGRVDWLTGANAGIVSDVKQSLSGTTFALWEPLPYPIQVGDTAQAYRGCDKTFETCRDVFSNAVNFRGFPYVPSLNDLVSGDVA